MSNLKWERGRLEGKLRRGIHKDITKFSNFCRYCNSTASLHLCAGKTEGVHYKPSGIYAFYSIFSWRMFFPRESQEEEKGKEIAFSCYIFPSNLLKTVVFRAKRNAPSCIPTGNNTGINVCCN